MGRMTEKEQERFKGKCKKGKNGCILFAGRVDKDGYGIFHFRRKNRRAHRVSYWNERGDIPEGFVVDHACRVRNCVNPDHLRVTTAEKHNRLRRGSTCSKGHKFDREYGKQQYCSICDREKSKRLRAKWKAEGDPVNC